MIRDDVIYDIINDDIYIEHGSLGRYASVEHSRHSFKK